jgi:hypothetical protein
MLLAYIIIYLFMASILRKIICKIVDMLRHVAIEASGLKECSREHANENVVTCRRAAGNDSVARARYRGLVSLKACICGLGPLNFSNDWFDRAVFSFVPVRA